MKNPIAKLLFILILFTSSACAQPNFYNDSATSKDQNIDYLISLPVDYEKNADQKHPVLLFLHGGDGSNTKHHPKKYATETGIDFPFIVIAPHCNGNCSWSTVDFRSLINEIAQTYPIDDKRIYITGYSYGGYGTWSAITNNSDLFTAAAPICGGGNPDKICKAKNISVKAFHAQDDPITPYSKSVEMIDALKECGADAELKTAISGGHGIWPYIYKDPTFYEWLLSKVK